MCEVVVLIARCLLGTQCAAGKLACDAIADLMVGILLTGKQHYCTSVVFFIASSQLT